MDLVHERNTQIMNTMEQKRGGNELNIVNENVVIQTEKKMDLSQERNNTKVNDIERKEGDDKLNFVNEKMVTYNEKTFDLVHDLIPKKISNTERKWNENELISNRERLGKHLTDFEFDNTSLLKSEEKRNNGGQESSSCVLVGVERKIDYFDVYNSDKESDDESGVDFCKKITGNSKDDWSEVQPGKTESESDKCKEEKDSTGRGKDSTGRRIYRERSFTDVLVNLGVNDRENDIVDIKSDLLKVDEKNISLRESCLLNRDSSLSDTNIKSGCLAGKINDVADNEGTLNTESNKTNSEKNSSDNECLEGGGNFTLETYSNDRVINPIR